MRRPSIFHPGFPERFVKFHYETDGLDWIAGMILAVTDVDEIDKWLELLYRCDLELACVLGEQETEASATRR